MYFPKRVPTRRQEDGLLEVSLIADMKSDITDSEPIIKQERDIFTPEIPKTFLNLSPIVLIRLNFLNTLNFLSLPQN